MLGCVLIFHDVTRERELARMKTGSRQLSHELRTPLTSILGFAKIIERRFSDVILPKWQSETKKEERAVNQIVKFRRHHFRGKSTDETHQRGLGYLQDGSGKDRLELCSMQVR